MPFSPDLRYWVRWDFTILVILDMKTGKEYTYDDTKGGTDNTIKFSPDGNHLAFTSMWGDVYVMSMENKDELVFVIPGKRISSLSFIDNDTLAGGSREGGLVYMWSIVDGKELRRMDGFERNIGLIPILERGFVPMVGGDSTWNECFFACGSQLACYTIPDDNMYTMVVLSTTDGKQVHELVDVLCVGYSPCEMYLLACVYDDDAIMYKDGRYHLLCGKTFVTIFTGLSRFNNLTLDWNT